MVRNNYKGGEGNYIQMLIMNKFKYVLIFFTWICLLSCSESDEDLNSAISAKDEVGNTDNFSNSDFSILFIGNSLTYTNNLSELVKSSAKLKGIIIATEMIAFPNYAIIDHWNDGVVQEQIASKKYDFVIIQQGPSSQSWGREILIEYGKKFSELCKENDTKLSYFMVWPSLTNYHTFDGVIKNYRDAASINNAILCPVGEVWKEYFDTTNNFDYYSPDGFHPSLKGSQVAADVIVKRLLGK